MEATYTAYPGYGPYYGGYGGGPYYNGPYYGGYPGSVTVEVGDRPYYTPRGEAIMLAAPITSGDQDIGHRGTGSESGSTAITSCEEDI